MIQVTRKQEVSPISRETVGFIEGVTIPWHFWILHLRRCIFPELTAV